MVFESRPLYESNAKNETETNAKIYRNIQFNDNSMRFRIDYLTFHANCLVITLSEMMK